MSEKQYSWKPVLDSFFLGCCLGLFSVRLNNIVEACMNVQKALDMNRNLFVKVNTFSEQVRNKKVARYQGNLSHTDSQIWKTKTS